MAWAVWRMRARGRKPGPGGWCGGGGRKVVAGQAGPAAVTAMKPVPNGRWPAMTGRATGVVGVGAGGADERRVEARADVGAPARGASCVVGDGARARACRRPMRAGGRRARAPMERCQSEVRSDDGGPDGRGGRDGRLAAG